MKKEGRMMRCDIYFGSGVWFVYYPVLSRSLGILGLTIKVSMGLRDCCFVWRVSTDRHWQSGPD